MKFPHLPIGQRFRFQDKLYTKTGPLTASEEGSGNSRLMMKSAEVEPLDLQVEKKPKGARSFSQQQVRGLFDQACRDLLQANPGDETKQLLEVLQAGFYRRLSGG
ncbi:MAG: polysulfide reductase chain A [gamma proteobacterium endosymbiont of Lamellibrachia anaximandri]|nr:polysulfide reductase chain A [gamma proteobacterium endosymbiont of Lamellibrachia anaximandri]MBL3617595.1 polysulfide reductase chain A [gamma proteobacterium endosymbiont of Lamellibrachia anaximandri]